MPPNCSATMIVTGIAYVLLEILSISRRDPRVSPDKLQFRSGRKSPSVCFGPSRSKIDAPGIHPAIHEVTGSPSAPPCPFNDPAMPMKGG